MTSTASTTELFLAERMTVAPDRAAFLTVVKGRVEVYAVSRMPGASRRVAFLAELQAGEGFPSPPPDSGHEYVVVALETSTVESAPGGSIDPGRLSMANAAWYARVLPPEPAAGKGETRTEEARDRGRELARLIADHFTTENERFDERAGGEAKRKARLMAGAFGHLLRTEYADADAVADAVGTSADSETRVLRIVARHLGLPLSDQRLPPDVASRMDALARLRRLADKSRLRLRLVKLPAGWENSDSGPLVGYYGPEREVSAILPGPGGGYTLFRGDNAASLPVTREVAANIHADAFACYSDPPPRETGPRDAFLGAMRRAWGRDWRAICLVSLVAGLLPMAMPLITESIFSDIIPINDRRALGTVAQVMLVSGFASVTLAFVRSVACLRLKCRVGTTLEAALWSHLLRLPARFFRDFQVGDLINRMQAPLVLGTVFDTAFTSGLFSVAASVWSLALMLYYSVRMTLFSVAAWIVYLAIAWVVHRRLVEYQTRSVETANRTTATVLQVLEGMSVFRLRGAEEQAFLLWSKAFGEGWRWNLALRRQGNRIAVVNHAMPILLSMLVFYLAAGMIKSGAVGGADGGLTFSQFLAFYGLFGSVTAAVAGIVPLAASIYGLKPHFENLSPILQAEPESQENKADAGLLSGKVEARHLRFRYLPGGPEVVRDVSFTVNAGETAAFVGTSGCGKSTLVRLLLGFEKPDSGGIFYDGLDLAALNPGSVRSQTGVVLQNGRLMAGDIFTNIVGTLPLTMDDAWEAARMVGLANDIERMPMGMHTVISEGGSNLSGGQRQRVLLARSLVNRPRIIILDEATSSLDNATQAMVTESLDRLKATRIVIAHRLSTIRTADRIYVMNAGRIVEEGTFPELMAKGGWFSRLAARQL